MGRLEAQLPTLTGFILPGGHITSGWGHMARTVCRRAERHVVGLSLEADDEKEREQLQGVIVFLNRLSDYLFLFARLCNMKEGFKDILWMK